MTTLQTQTTRKMQTRATGGHESEGSLGPKTLRSCAGCWVPGLTDPSVLCFFALHCRLLVQPLFPLPSATTLEGQAAFVIYCVDMQGGLLAFSGDQKVEMWSRDWSVSYGRLESPDRVCNGLPLCADWVLAHSIKHPHVLTPLKQALRGIHGASEKCRPATVTTSDVCRPFGSSQNACLCARIEEMQSLNPTEAPADRPTTGGEA